MPNDVQPTWLKPGQSLRDFIAARRPLRQLGRKSASNVAVFVQPQLRQQSIRRMTPQPSSSLKRSREEPAARFIDLRLHQARKRAQTARFGTPIYHRQAFNIDDSRPRKKLATGQVAIKSAPGLATFSKHVMAATMSISAGKPPQAKSAARKMPLTVQFPSSDEAEEEDTISEEDELESSSPESNIPKYKIGVALKSAPRYRSSTPTSNGNDDEHSTSPMLISPVVNERTTPPLVPTVQVEPQIQLFRAFNRHTDPPLSLQDEKRLPFLLRNLRKSFRVLCRSLNIPNSPEGREQGSVLVRYEHVANAWFEGTLPKWFCPLCDLFGKFETREMLKVHLGLDHKDVFFEWSQTTQDHEGTSWRLLVLMPETDKQHVTTAPSPSPPAEPPLTLPPSTTQTRCTSVTISDEPESKPITHHTLPPRPPPSSDDPYSLFPPDELNTTSALPSLSPSPPMQKKPRPPQYPRPPPSSHRLGPAARKPYLPAKSPYGGPDIDYSTRIGGPYLFDLLQLLPLEPYGLLDWLVLEREAEIFNDDELGDELKVIVALWARWMMLNRNAFVKDRVEGMKMFIEQYWEMIHLAAGWEALVYQILVLVAYRLIGQGEVVPLILHYEKLVGMDYWDEWDSNEE